MKERQPTEHKRVRKQQGENVYSTSTSHLSHRIQQQEKGKDKNQPC